jgi:1,4-dihydroxy-2-naphthoate polyprenyltransferase
MSDLKQLIGAARLNFLILTPSCVLLGLGTALWSGADINFMHFVLALVGGVCAHASVNAFNEYFDFKSGLDLKTIKTPFSGGTGTLPKHPDLAVPTLVMAWATLAVTALIGIYFMYVRGLAILPLGLAGLILIYAYTPWIVHNRYWCLVAPGLGFGPVMVIGTHVVLAGTYALTAVVASLVPFFLVSNLLLLNQFPDVEPDRSVGRSHFPITSGKRAGSLIYCSFTFLAYLSLLLGVAFHLLPKPALLGMVTIAPAAWACLGAVLHAENINKLVFPMTLNVVINITTPLLMAIGLFVS